MLDESLIYTRESIGDNYKMPSNKSTAKSTAYVALLRAVNVGGTGKLPMDTLTAICKAAGFKGVKTYIASGNVVFTSGLTASNVAASLESRLHEFAGKPVGVLIRTAAEMAAVLANNPFIRAAPNRTVAIFLPTTPQQDVLAAISGAVDEEVRLGQREIYVHYGAGMAASKLKIPAAKNGTARNMNTIGKLTAMSALLQ